jgi:membrane protein DedA with SNARE-associated domain
MHALAPAAFLFHSSTLDHLLSTYGYAAVFAFIAIESLGIPFPGETMLITAGIYTGTTHHLEIALVIAAAAAGAIIGDNIGYGIGHWGGYRLLLRYGKYVRVDAGKLKLGRYIFVRHGAKVVFFGRFVSILRTYAAFLAGTNRMHWKRFLFFNATGGIVWALIYGLASYFLGKTIDKLSTPVDIALAVVGALAIVAFVVFLRRNEKRLEEEAERAFPGDITRLPGVEVDGSGEVSEDDGEPPSDALAARSEHHRGPGPDPGV